MVFFLWRYLANAFASSEEQVVIDDSTQLKVGDIVSARYRWDSICYAARIKSKDPNDTFSVAFEWGCWQMNTPTCDMILITDNATIRAYKNKELAAMPRKVNVEKDDEEDEDDVWLAARRGDLKTVMELVRNGAPLDEPEILEDVKSDNRIKVNGDDLLGRTPLYWACLCGHSELVEWLLSNGARDTDGSAFAAVTGSKPVRHGDDERDLIFDPDENIYSDFVDRAADAHIRSTLEIDAQDANSVRIRQLLLKSATAADTSASVSESIESALSPGVVGVRMVGGTGLCPMPERLYSYEVDQDDKVCVVCTVAQIDAVSVPCGHAVACMACLRTIRNAREYGCPVCRSQIRDILRLEEVIVQA